jgi:hypothetical protein
VYINFLANPMFDKGREKSNKIAGGLPERRESM